METVVIMPEVTKVAVEKVIKVMEMGWEKSVIFDKEVVILFNNLNIFLGESLIDIKKELKEAEDEQKHNIVTKKEEDKIESIDIIKSITNKYEDKITHKQITTKCPNCPR